MMTLRTILLMALAALLCQAGANAAARSLQQTVDAAVVSNAIAAYQRDPNGTANALASLVSSSGSSSQLASLLQQAVAAVGTYRQTLTSQLPVPVGSLTSLKGVTNLDTALAGKAATYVLQQLGDSKYQQVVDGLKTLLTSNGGGAAPGYISRFESYTTALAFVEALAKTQDGKGDTSAVASSFVNGLESAAESCIKSLPSINGVSSSSVITNELNKCCPVISQTLADAKTLAGQSGLVNFLQAEEAKYNIVKQCSALSTGGNS